MTSLEESWRWLESHQVGDTLFYFILFILIWFDLAPLHARTQALIAAALNVKINLAYGSTENCGNIKILNWLNLLTLTLWLGPASALHIDDLALGSCGGMQFVVL